jgi:hypothetical protein
MKDDTGGADMTQGNLTRFAADRFGNPNSALDLNGGWTQLPAGIYFNTPEFSVSLWVYPQSVPLYSRILDFANGQSDNVLVTILYPNFDIYSGVTGAISVKSFQNVTFNQWQFLTFTFDGIRGNVYLNGNLVGNKTITQYTMSAISRTNCYFGRSAWPTDGYTSSYLDDIRFYNVSLTQSEVIQSMNQNFTGEFIIYYYFPVITSSFVDVTR